MHVIETPTVSWEGACAKGTSDVAKMRIIAIVMMMGIWCGSRWETEIFLIELERGLERLRCPEGSFKVTSSLAFCRPAAGSEL